MRTTAEEIDRTSAPYHLQRPLPGGRSADSFYNSICPELAVCLLTHSRDDIVNFRAVNCYRGTDVFRRFNLAATFADGNHTYAAARHDADKLQPDWTATDNDRCIARPDAGLFDSPQHAGKRLQQCGIHIGEVRWDFHHILAQYASGARKSTR